MMSIHVCPFKKVMGNVFEVVIPDNFKELTCVGFTSIGINCSLYSLTHSLIDANKVRRADDYTITVEIVDGNYMVGDVVLTQFDPYGGHL